MCLRDALKYSKCWRIIMLTRLIGLIFALVGGLSIAVLSTNFGPKIIGLIIFGLIFFAILLHLFLSIRNRIKIKIIKQSFHESLYYVKFEALNLGEKPNSMQEKVYFECLLPSINKSTLRNGDPHKLVFLIRDNDRILEPHKPKILSAYTKATNHQLCFSWFRKYEFRPSRGMYTHIFVRNS